jgi:hypothetical protein
VARDRTRNAYFTIGIPLNSETYRALKADAEETGVSLPLLLGVRIADWYKGGRTGAITQHQPLPSVESIPEQAEQAMPNPIQARALAAAAVWGADDDDQ